MNLLFGRLLLQCTLYTRTEGMACISFSLFLLHESLFTARCVRAALPDSPSVTRRPGAHLSMARREREREREREAKERAACESERERERERERGSSWTFTLILRFVGKGVGLQQKIEKKFPVSLCFSIFLFVEEREIIFYFAFGMKNCFPDRHFFSFFSPSLVARSVTFMRAEEKRHVSSFE